MGYDYEIVTIEKQTNKRKPRGENAARLFSHYILYLLFAGFVFRDSSGKLVGARSIAFATNPCE